MGLDAVVDGSTEYFRMVNESGVKTDDVRRTFDIDNIPAAQFHIYWCVEIQDAVGLPVLDNVTGWTLTVKFSVKSVGDLDAFNYFQN